MVHPGIGRNINSTYLDQANAGRIGTPTNEKFGNEYCVPEIKRAAVPSDGGP